MVFDPILGVGHQPRAQPAIQSLNATFNHTADASGIDHSESIEISDDMAVQFWQCTLNFQNAGGHIPTVQLLRNGIEIDRIVWNITLGDIVTSIGTGLIYSFVSNRSDFLRGRDTITLRLTANNPTGNPETYVFTFNLNIVGRWV